MDRVEYTRKIERDKERPQHRAHVINDNGRILFASSEGYDNFADLERIVDRLFPDLPKERVGDGW